MSFDFDPPSRLSNDSRDTNKHFGPRSDQHERQAGRNTQRSGPDQRSGGDTYRDPGSRARRSDSYSRSRRGEPRSFDSLPPDIATNVINVLADRYQRAARRGEPVSPAYARAQKVLADERRRNASRPTEEAPYGGAMNREHMRKNGWVMPRSPLAERLSPERGDRQRPSSSGEARSSSDDRGQHSNATNDARSDRGPRRRGRENPIPPRDGPIAPEYRPTDPRRASNRTSDSERVERAANGAIPMPGGPAEQTGPSRGAKAREQTSDGGVSDEPSGFRMESAAMRNARARIVAEQQRRRDAAARERHDRQRADFERRAKQFQEQNAGNGKNNGNGGSGNGGPPKTGFASPGDDGRDRAHEQRIAAERERQRRQRFADANERARLRSQELAERQLREQRERARQHERDRLGDGRFKLDHERETAKLIRKDLGYRVTAVANDDNGNGDAILRTPAGVLRTDFKRPKAGAKNGIIKGFRTNRCDNVLFDLTQSGQKPSDVNRYLAERWRSPGAFVPRRIDILYHDASGRLRHETMDRSHIEVVGRRNGINNAEMDRRINLPLHQRGRRGSHQE